MANYFADFQAVGHATLAVGALYEPASGMRRIKVYQLIVGCEAASGDTVTPWAVQRSTTAPTATVVTPSPHDPADPATGILAGETVTVNGTLTAGIFPLRVPLNQRSAFQWVAKTGKEIIVPATANNGLHFLTTNVATQGVLVHFED